jgi:MFS family permease
MQNQPSNSPHLRKVLGVHPDVLKLGIVSFLTDLSSEMIFSVFAIFLTTIAGASTALLGLIEGCADLSASSLNYLAGWLSDRSGKRKLLTLTGYAFSTLAKGILVISSGVAGLGIFRIVERLGKGFRGPPRDAWLASVAEQATRGYAFGLHKALDKSGAVIGPLVAYSLLSCLGESSRTYHALFVLAVIPAALAVLLLCLTRSQPSARIPHESISQNWRNLNTAFKRYLIVSTVFSFAYFSFSFLLLRAHNAGFSVKDIVLLYALFNVSCVFASPLVGMLGDHIGRGKTIIFGYVSYALMSIGFIFASSATHIIFLFIFFGVFYSIDEAQSKAFIADLEQNRRGSAIGLYNGVTGMVYLPASLIAGVLWLKNPTYAFIFAAAVSTLACVLFAYLRPDRLPH